MTLLVDVALRLVVIVAIVAAAVLAIPVAFCYLWAVAHPLRAYRVMAAIVRHPGVPSRLKSACVVVTVNAAVMLLLGIVDAVQWLVEGHRALVKSTGLYVLALALLGIWVIPLLELINPKSSWRRGKKSGLPLDVDEKGLAFKPISGRLPRW